MKLIYIAKLNLFVYVVDEGLVSGSDQERIRDNIEAQLSDIEPKPHILVANCPFEIVDDNHNSCN